MPVTQLELLNAQMAVLVAEQAKHALEDQKRIDDLNTQITAAS